MDFFTEDIIKEILNYPTIVGTLVLSWFFVKIIMALINVIKSERENK